VAKHNTAREDGRLNGNALRAVRGRGDKASARADGLDRLIHERLRLGIVSALAVNDTLSFSDLKKLMKTTDGNLSVHARKLEEADYIACTKSFEGRMPRTQYRLTSSGRRALERYAGALKQWNPGAAT
jgi:DNA-binding HxlR family transcriptional regulator